MSFKTRPDQIDTGEFDATVGAATTGADYNDINTATAASKFNLLVIGDFTQPTAVTTVASQVILHIAERLTTEDIDIDVGVAGIKVRGALWRYKFTGATNKIFKSSATATLDLADIAFFNNSSTTVNTGLGNMATGSKHLVNNCKFSISNTAECGFKNPGDGSSFVGLNVIGGGAACEGFILGARDSVISDINISGTVNDGAIFISSSTTPCVINSIRFTGTNRPIISLGVDGNQVDNINGDIEIDITNTSENQVSNCYVSDIDLSDTNAEQNKFSNINNISTNMTIGGVFNQFCNFSSNANLIVDGGANFFVHARIPNVTVNGDANQFITSSFTVYTDNGSDNAYISEVTEDGTFASNSDRLLATQKAIKTYVDGQSHEWTKFTGTPNYLLPKVAGDNIGATGTRITKGWFADLESTNMPTVGGTSINANAALDLASAEVTQLANIGATIIDVTQWTFLGAMNQGVTTTDTPTFAQLTVDNLILNDNLLSASTGNLDLKAVSATGLIRFLKDTGLPAFQYDNSTDQFTFFDDLNVAIGGEIAVNTIENNGSIFGVTIEDVELLNGAIKADSISELTGSAGVTIEGAVFDTGGVVAGITDLSAGGCTLANGVISCGKTSGTGPSLSVHDDTAGDSLVSVIKDAAGDKALITFKATAGSYFSCGLRENNNYSIYNHTLASFPFIIDVTDDSITASSYINQAGIFASIYVAGASTAQQIATGATYVKSTAFTTNGQSSNATSDSANDKIILTQIGRYRVTHSVCAKSGTANVVWQGAAFLNGTVQNNLHWKRKLTTNTDVGNMGFSDFIDVTSVPWDLDLRLRHDNGGAIDFTIEYANLNVEYMGAT